MDIKDQKRMVTLNLTVKDAQVESERNQKVYCEIENFKNITQYIRDSIRKKCENGEYSLTKAYVIRNKESQEWEKESGMKLSCYWDEDVIETISKEGFKVKKENQYLDESKKLLFQSISISWEEDN